MRCEECGWQSMTKKFHSTVPEIGYTTLFIYECPECEYTFMAVA